jgi:uncharacterized protein YPO0396
VKARSLLVSTSLQAVFHQTVSMKSVGDLTDFVREHMLKPFPVDERVRALRLKQERISFDWLRRALTPFDR